MLTLNVLFIKRVLYGGLHIRMRRLSSATATARVTHDLLIQNTVALVAFEPQPSDNHVGRYSIQQVYLGVREGKLEEVAHQHM